MIAKQTTGSASSSGKMVDYALRENGLKHSDEKVNIIYQNSCYGTHAEIKEQMKMALDLNKEKCKMPMFHAIFSLAENEQLNSEQELTLSEKLIKEFKLENNIIIGVKHTSNHNKDHYHFIVALTPIDGSATPNMFRSKMRLMEIARSCELEFGLKQVESPKIEKGQKRNRSRNNERFQIARYDLKKALTSSKSMTEFISKMNDAGYSLRKGRGLGIVQNATGMYYKASDLGYSLSKIEQSIALNNVSNNHGASIQSSKNENSHDHPFSELLINTLVNMGNIGGNDSTPLTEDEKEKRRKKNKNKESGLSL